MIATRKFICIFSLLLLSFYASFSAKVDTINIYSEVMKRSFRCVVVVPSSYAYYEDTRYPVVYLLHGYSGNYADWISKVPALSRYADQYNMIIVCPDGGFGSWYFDSPIDPNSKFKTYIGQEVPDHIDTFYRTMKNRLARVITGLSMGGHGALYLAWSFPHTFGAAGSMSGAVDLVPWKEKYNLEKLLGPASQTNVYYNYSAINKLRDPLVQLPRLIIDCGAQDPFIDDNRNLHAMLIEKNIPHDYIERKGKHEWGYWENAIAFQLLFFHRYFEHNP